MASARLSVRAPTLQWLAARGAQTVVVCRARLCDPSDVVWSARVEGSSARVPTQLAPGRYYWRVSSLDSQGAMRSSATWSFHVPQRSAPVESVVGSFFDADGDGRDDVVAMTNYRFATLYGEAARRDGWAVSDRFAGIVASAGDLDGDGLSDASIGADCLGRSECDGRAFVRLGTRDRREATAFELHPDALSADWIGAAGDVDRDGFGDAIVVTHAAGLFVVHGGPTGATRRSPARSIQGISPYFFTTAAAGDVDGDGFGDIVAARSEERAITVRVFFGAREGIDEARSVSLSLDASSAFGPAVSGAGDVDGDGYADVLVGAQSPVVMNARGSFWVVYGGPRDRALSRRARLDGTVDNASIGNIVRGVGDVDGDGFDDVAASGGFVWGATMDRGVLQLFRGGASGVSHAATFSDGRSFGHGIAGPTDLDGDGFFDVVGHRLDGAEGAGAVVFRGRSGTMPAMAPEFIALPMGAFMAGPLG